MCNTVWNIYIETTKPFLEALVEVFDQRKNTDENREIFVLRPIFYFQLKHVVVRKHDSRDRLTKIVIYDTGAVEGDPGTMYSVTNTYLNQEIFTEKTNLHYKLIAKT